MAEIKEVTNSQLGDRGFSLVEIVVAMFTLAVLSLALIPALIFGIEQAKDNAVMAAATSSLSARMDEARGQTATCQAVTSFAGSTLGDQVEAHGIVLKINQQLDACPTTYPGTVRYTASIVRQDTGATLLTASILIYLQSAS